jgi:hypothetical protein
MIYTTSAKWGSVLAGDGELDRPIRLSGVIGLAGDGDITETALLAWTNTSECAGDLITGDGDVDATALFTRDVSPPLGDAPHGRSCDSGGDMDAKPWRTFSGPGLARHTGHVARDSSHTSTQLAWK